VKEWKSNDIILDEADYWSYEEEGGGTANWGFEKCRKDGMESSDL
jgi:hypothetical protein